jgi:ParB family chromosome partitioning protein
MAEERTALAELDAREAELACECEAVNESDEWSAADAERIDLEEQDIALRRRSIEAGLRRWTDEAKARAGVIVTIGREGEAEVIRGLSRAGGRVFTAPPAFMRPYRCGSCSPGAQGPTPGIGRAGAVSRCSTHSLVRLC